MSNDTFDAFSDDITVQLRCSDNVLDRAEWTVVRVYIREGRVVDMGIEHAGVYTPPECIGWGIDQLVTWLNEDRTGYHPEIYNEIRFSPREPFRYAGENEIYERLYAEAPSGR